ncbi:cell division protein SepF [Vagococcus elongatus]|uniref:Cell division protein SepF n=1 Tax=Vagococcus elongatus TaxID=180344 RepID=A0A430AYC4_9ENTE|nr:cell division protein SepF [Vagococcus elongatus]RSU13063.1 hypothetical protein CBF29_05175 [Vagococcus elongatus]
MSFALTTEKIQKFFGLDGASDYDNDFEYSQPVQATQEVRQPAHRQSQYSKQPTREPQNRSTSEPRGGRQTNRSSTARESSSKNESNVLSMEKAVVSRESRTENKHQGKVKGDGQVKKIAIIEPRTYTEAKDIAKAIFRNEVVIINFRLVEESQARRIVDFLTGTVYALDGDIQRLDGLMFICTPANMEIDSAVAKSLLRTQFSDF